VGLPAGGSLVVVGAPPLVLKKTSDEGLSGCGTWVMKVGRRRWRSEEDPMNRNYKIITTRRTHLNVFVGSETQAFRIARRTVKKSGCETQVWELDGSKQWVLVGSYAPAAGGAR